MLRDLFFAARSLRNSPGFTLVAILTLSLGIGANTAMFSIVNSVLLRPLPGYRTDRLVNILDPRGNGHLDPKAFRQIREQSKSFEQVAGLQFCTSNLTGLAEPEMLVGPCTTSNYFELQKIQPFLGRTFLPDEDKRGRSHVVILDYAFWQQRFGGDPKVLASTITLNQQPWHVIGIMPRDFKPLGVVKPTLFIPFVTEDNPTGIIGLGRLKPGVGLQAARAEMKLISAELARLDPADWKDVELRLEPALDNLTGAQRPLLLILMGAVSFVLLIACVNVASLSLARATGRQHEVAIRAALGATRWHIIRLVLAECCLLSIAASVLAVALAQLSLGAMKPLTANLPRVDELNIDWRVLLAALSFGLTAAVLSALVPALRSARGEGTAGMRARSGAAWQGALLSGEVALAFVLLAGAGLMIRSFVNMRGVNLGYDPHNVLTAFLALAPSSQQTTSGAESLYGRIRQRLSALPGVTGVATASATPAGGVMIAMDVQPAGQPAPPNARRASVNVVSDDYFRVAGIALRAGRYFAATDQTGSAPVAIVSESIAKRYFGGMAIGRSMVIPQMAFNLDDSKDVQGEIVGVVGNICSGSVTNCEAEHIYLPESQSALRLNFILVRTQGNPMLLARAVRREVAAESPAAPIDEPRTLESRASNLTDAPARGMWLLGVFAGLALVLAGSGIYAVSAYLAEQRRLEIGIRKALGARTGQIVTLLCRRSLIAAVWGLAVGAVAAFGLSKSLRSLLFGVSPADPVTNTVAAAGILALAIAAALGPALRAALRLAHDSLRAS